MPKASRRGAAGGAAADGSGQGVRRASTAARWRAVVLRRAAGRGRGAGRRRRRRPGARWPRSASTAPCPTATRAKARSAASLTALDAAGRRRRRGARLRHAVGRRPKPSASLVDARPPTRRADVAVGDERPARAAVRGLAACGRAGPCSSRRSPPASGPPHRAIEQARRVELAVTVRDPDAPEREPAR